MIVVVMVMMASLSLECLSTRPVAATLGSPMLPVPSGDMRRVLGFHDGFYRLLGEG